MFCVGILFFINWVYNFSLGTPDDSWIFAILFLIWGWDNHPNLLKKKWIKEKWTVIRYRHVVTLESTEEGFYEPIYEWIVKNIENEKENVWLNLEQESMIIAGVTGNAVTMLLEGRTFEFRFKKKKDAMQFKLVWG